MRADVAFVLPALAGGGVERVYLDLAGAMAERGLRVEFILAKAEGPLLDQVSSGVRVVDLGAPRRLRLIRTYGPLVAYLSKARPRAVVPVWGYLDLVPLSAAWRVGIPFLWVLHNSLAYFMDVPNALKRGVALWTARKALRKAVAHSLGRVAAVSKAVGQEFARFAGVPEGAIHLLPNPIHVDRIRRLAEEELPIGVRGPYFLAIGRLHPQKDFGLLLEAFSFLVNGHPEVQLVILGDGPERGYLEEVSRQLGIRDRVSFLGFVANPYPYLRRAKALVVTSRYEGMPMVALEALALQVPVLAVRSRGGLEEALGNGRFGLITPRSAEALADGMRRLLSSSFEWDIASLEEHLRWFSVDNALRAYLGVLEQIWR